MQGNIYLDFELSLDPPVLDAGGLEQVLNEKIRFWNQNTNYNPKYKILADKAERYIAAGMPDRQPQAEKARNVKRLELQEKVTIIANAGIGEAVTNRLVREFSPFFTEDTVLAELSRHSVLSGVFVPEFVPPPKPAQLQSEKNITFADMLAIEDDLKFFSGGRCKDLYELLRLPMTASTEQLYASATAAAERIDKFPRSNPKADPLNRLSRKFMLYFGSDVYRRSYDTALHRLPFDKLAAEVFDWYADAFRSNQKTDGKLWKESVAKTLELYYTKEEAEYLVYEFYCVTRKCPYPVQTEEEPPQNINSSGRENLIKEAVNLLPKVLLSVLAVTIIIMAVALAVSGFAVDKLMSQKEEYYQRSVSAEQECYDLKMQLKDANKVNVSAAEKLRQQEEKIKELEKKPPVNEPTVSEPVSEKPAMGVDAQPVKPDLQNPAREDKPQEDGGTSSVANNAALKAGDPLEFTLKGVKWRFRRCPAGTFMMGSPESEKDRGNDETQHKVTLTKGFWMGETETTQEMWQAVMGNNPSGFKGVKNPVELVSWNDCQVFMKKFNESLAAASAAGDALLKQRLNGFVASLPTEAQWEYACWAGSTTAFCFGDDWKQLEQYAWFSGHMDYKEFKTSKEYENKIYSKWGYTTHPVGLKKPNAWGLYDMHGNVWEWCNDWYGDYPAGDATDPLGASSGSNRVLRGGSWYSYARDCRSSYRYCNTPDYRDSAHGLRVSLVFR